MANVDQAAVAECVLTYIAAYCGRRIDELHPTDQLGDLGYTTPWYQALANALNDRIPLHEQRFRSTWFKDETTVRDTVLSAVDRKLGILLEPNEADQLIERSKPTRQP